MKMTAEMAIERLFKYFNVFTVSELAEQIGVKQPIISGWKSRNSINPLKKKCQELGIYDDIFAGYDHTFKQPISKENINAKLFLFNVRSLICFQFLIKQNNINNSDDLYSWRIEREQSNVLKKIFIGWDIDKQGNITIPLYLKETEEYIDHLIQNDELNYILSHKDIFIKSINFIVKQKR